MSFADGTSLASLTAAAAPETTAVAVSEHADRVPLAAEVDTVRRVTRSGKGVHLHPADGLIVVLLTPRAV